MIPHGFYAFFTETSSNTLSKCTLVSEDQIPKSKNSLRVITFEIGLTKAYSLINYSLLTAADVHTLVLSQSCTNFFV